MEWLLLVALVALLALGIVVAVRRRSAKLPEGVTDPSVRAAVNRQGGPGTGHGSWGTSGGV